MTTSDTTVVKTFSSRVDLQGLEPEAVISLFFKHVHEVAGTGTVAYGSGMGTALGGNGSDGNGGYGRANDGGPTSPQTLSHRDAQGDLTEEVSVVKR